MKVQLVLILILSVVPLFAQELKTAQEYIERGKKMQTRRELDKAMDDFSAAIKLDPKNVDAYLARSQIRLMKNEREKAIQDLDEAIKIQPQSAEAYSRRGMVHFTIDPEKSIGDFNQALKIDPKHLRSLVRRGGYWFQKPDYDKALADLDVALIIKEDDYTVISLRCEILLLKKQFDKAIEACDALSKLNPKEAANVVVQANRACAYLEKKEYEKAKHEFESAMKAGEPLRQYYAQRKYALALASCSDDKFRDGKKALELAEKLCESDKSYWENLQLLAAAYAETGRFDDAIQLQESNIANLKTMKSMSSTPGFFDKILTPLQSQLALYKDKKPYRE